jgi:hypothetical protein
MLFGYICFVLLCICALLLLSPVVLRFSKGREICLSLHFVFFSLVLSRGASAKETKRESSAKKEKKPSRRSAFLRALRYAMPRTTIFVARLSLPRAENPFHEALGYGGCCFLLSLLLAPFGRQTDRPLLNITSEEDRSLDIHLQMRFYAFLHTFLIYKTQYRKEKEAKRFYVRNENE